MKAVAGELVVMVGDRRDGANQGRVALKPKFKVETHKGLEVAAATKISGRKTLKIYKGKEISPEQISRCPTVGYDLAI